MRKLIALAIATTGIAVAIISTAGATRPAASTIEQCATFLPQGKTYAFEISGTVDTKGATPALSGEMSVTDGTAVDRTAETAEFAQCMAKLIR